MCVVASALIAGMMLLLLVVIELKLDHSVTLVNRHFIFVATLKVRVKSIDVISVLWVWAFWRSVSAIILVITRNSIEYRNSTASLISDMRRFSRKHKVVLPCGFCFLLLWLLRYFVLLT